MKRRKKVFCVCGCYVILLISFLYGVLALWIGLPFLKEPLHVDLGMSWAILALISMLTLTYVQLINRLGEYLHENLDRQEASWQRASWQKVFLSWTTGILFITIFFLTLRITYLSFDPEAYQYSCFKGLILFDWIILTSFILGSFMRIGIFLDSYWEDFTKHIWKHL
jgi:hypothetical protein